MAAPISLWQAFRSVPDPRSPLGRRYPLPAVLSLVAVAVLAGARSLFAVARFGRNRGRGFAEALGIDRKSTPANSTLFYLFRRLDVAAFEAALRTWAAGREAAAGWRAAAIDGKTLCGTTGQEVPGVHLLAAYAHETGQVLAQLRVDSKTNEHKAALELLGLIDIKDKVATGDAMFCQRDLSAEVVGRGGHYLWTVKANQPELRRAIASAFDDRDLSPL